MQEKQFAEDYLIYKCVAGSYAYGTQIEGVSDRDTRGCFIAPPSHILSCFQTVEQCEDAKKDDVIFELRKFMKLAADCNPNIIELLFMDDSDVLFCDWPFQLLRDNRHLFLSKKAKYTFSGYAMAQMKRIKGHNKWILNPRPEAAPMLSEFARIVDMDGKTHRGSEFVREFCKDKFLVATYGRSQTRIFRSSQFYPEKCGFFNEDETDLRIVDVSDEVLDRTKATFCGFLFVDLDEFGRKRTEHKEYWRWKRNRNEARAELEAQFKYDTKHAMHLVRLMSIAKEILTEGKVLVKRPDAARLLEIRHGKFDYDWLLKWSEDTDAELTELEKTSPLQYSADKAKIDDLYREIVLKYWKEKGLLA